MGSPQTQSFGYDNLDRLTSASASGGTGGIYSESYTLEYDAENRLSTVRQGATTIAAFSYDGDGGRVKGTGNGVTTAYVGEILEWTGSTRSMVK